MAINLNIVDFRKSIAARFAFFVLLFGTILIFCATSFEIYMDYKREVEGLKGHLDEVKTTRLQSIIASLWEADYELTQIQLDGIASAPDIQYVEVKLDDGALITSGYEDEQDVVTFSTRLIYPYRNQDVYLGSIYVSASKKGIHQRTKERFTIIFVSLFVEIFLSALFILLVFYFLVKPCWGLFFYFSRNYIYFFLILNLLFRFHFICRIFLVLWRDNPIV